MTSTPSTTSDPCRREQAGPGVADRLGSSAESDQVGTLPAGIVGSEGYCGFPIPMALVREPVGVTVIRIPRVDSAHPKLSVVCARMVS